jgi:subtilisin family serine protease
MGWGKNSGIIAAMDHVIKHCTNITGSSLCIINMSLGGGFSASFNLAVTKTEAAGIVVVISAGNGNKTGAIDACEVSPASITAAITVGSIANNTDKKYSSSNFGACVDVYTPGENILSAPNITSVSYTLKTGMSMASPRKC